MVTASHVADGLSKVDQIESKEIIYEQNFKKYSLERICN